MEWAKPGAVRYAAEFNPTMLNQLPIESPRTHAHTHARTHVRT